MANETKYNLANKVTELLQEGGYQFSLAIAALEGAQDPQDKRFIDGDYITELKSQLDEIEQLLIVP